MTWRTVRMRPSGVMRVMRTSPLRTRKMAVAASPWWYSACLRWYESTWLARSDVALRAPGTDRTVSCITGLFMRRPPRAGRPFGAARDGGGRSDGGVGPRARDRGPGQGDLPLRGRRSDSCELPFARAGEVVEPLDGVDDVGGEVAATEILRGRGIGVERGPPDGQDRSDPVQ